jgi:hypothetical protein
METLDHFALRTADPITQFAISTQPAKTRQAALRRRWRRCSIWCMKTQIVDYPALARSVLLAPVVLMLFAACSHKPEEQRLRETIHAMQTALESGNPRDFMANVSPDFVGQDGSVDHDGLHNILRAEVLRNDKIGITLGPIDVDIQGDRATTHVLATLTGGPGGLLPERGAIYTITSGWKLQGGNWRCNNAQWVQQL